MPDADPNQRVRRSWIPRLSDIPVIAVFVTITAFTVVMAGQFNIAPKLMAAIMTAAACVGAYGVLANLADMSTSRKLMAVATSVVLIVVAVITWPTTPTRNPVDTPSGPAVQPGSAQASAADGRKTIEASTLLAALRPNDQNIEGSVASGVSYEGRPTLEIHFAKAGSYYEAYFDLKRLVGGRGISRMSCFVNVGNLKNTVAPWGGIVFIDVNYKHDFGADVVFHDAPGDWIELEAVLGMTTEKNRTGRQALYEDGFQLSESLNGVAVFFNSNPDPELYLGKTVYVSACTVWPAVT